MNHRLLVFVLAAAPAASWAQAPGRFPACDPKAASQRVVFVHLSDLHANFNPGPNGTSPLARVRGYFDLVRSTVPYVVFTDGGDSHDKGSVVEQLSQGWATDRIVRTMDYDVRTMGNHDFAWAPDEPFAFSKDTETLVLASNITYTGKEPDRWGATDYGELQVGCVRVGFFGLVERSWSDQDEPSEAPYHPDLVLRRDYAARAREIVSRHRKDVQVLVMVSHLGLEFDEKIAAEVKGIDLVLGAHTHDILWNGKLVGDTLIVQAGQGARLIARTELVYDLVRSTVTEVHCTLIRNDHGSVPDSKTVEAAIAAEIARYAPDLHRPIAFVRSAKDKNGVGNFAASALAAALKTDAALVDYKTVWAAWTPGGLDMQDLADTFRVEREPPGTSGFNSMVVAEVVGEDMAKIRDGRDAGRFAFYGAGPFHPGKTYRLALQKRPATAPSRWLPAGATLRGLKPAGEVWEVLKGFAESRTAACLHLDSDEPLPACPRP